MGTEPIVESQTGSYRYEAVVRISEAITACREPEELARTLADEIGKFLQFDHLYFIVFKENSKEFFFSSRRRHTIWPRDWSSDVCSSDLFRLQLWRRNWSRNWLSSLRRKRSLNKQKGI